MFHTDFSTTFQLNKTSNNQKLAARWDAWPQVMMQ